MLVRLSLLAAVSAAFLAPSCAAARGSLQDGIFVSPNNLDSPPPTLDGSPYNLTWTNVQDPSTAAVRSVNMQLGTGTAKDVRIVNTSIGKVPWPAATSFAYTFPADLDPAAQYTVVWQALGLDETTVLGTAYVTWFKVLAAPGVLPTAANPTSGVPAANLTSGAPAAAPASGGPTAAPASAAPNVGAAAGNGTAGAESATPPAGSESASLPAPASPLQGRSPPDAPLGAQIEAKNAGAGISASALGTVMAVATAGFTRWTA